MKKKLIKRCLIGMPIGFFISYIITIIISLFVGDGLYYAVVPDLIDSAGSEINAVVIQSAVAMMYGAVCGGITLIWEIDKWSLLKQTIVHFVILSSASLPIAYFMYWMPHDIWGIIIYYAMFIAIYIIIWLSSYFKIKKEIKSINAGIKHQ